MTIDVARAEVLARDYLKEMSLQPGGVPYSIIGAKVVATPDGWYFPYQSTDFVQTNDFGYSLVGNWPIFVSTEGDVVEPRRPPLVPKSA